jgi:hypothetical protein
MTSQNKTTGTGPGDTARVQAEDEVRVFDRNGTRVGQPEGGWPGRIVKVGRTRAHITYKGVPWRQEETGESFSLEDGHNRDGFRWFCTLAEVEHDERMEAAKVTLRKHGIVFDFGARLTLDQVEALAKVAATFDQPTTSEATS